MDNETIVYEPITLQRMSDFVEIQKEYQELLDRKKKMTARLSSLPAVDYTRVHVANGSSKPISAQERYVLALERLNAEIRKYEGWLPLEKEIIKNQIARISKPRYRQVLILRYLERWKWSEIIEECFWFEPDFEEEKHNKYKDIVMYWNRRGLEELEKVSNKPYVPISRQLVLDEEFKVVEKEIGESL